MKCNYRNCNIQILDGRIDKIYCCVKCKRNEKKYRQRESKRYEKININFYRNHQFKDCKRIRNLKFDFYLPKLNLCIEYDGEHHFKNNSYFGKDNLEYITENDRVKNEY